MPGGAGQGDRPGDPGVMGEERGDQAAAAAVGQRRRMIGVATGHQGGDRAESLDLMQGACRVGVVAAIKHRRQEGLRRVGAQHIESVGIAQHQPRLGADPGGLVQHIGLLRQRGQRPHPAGLVGRIARRHLRQLGHQRLGHRVDQRFGHDHAANRGAFLAGLGGHLGHRLLDEQREFRAVGRGVGPEDRGVQAVLLGDEARRVARQRRVGAQLQRGRGRAGEADHILRAQPVEQIAGAADDQLHRALGQDAAVDDHPKGGLGQIAGLGRGFHDRRHPGQQAGGKLFQHPPDREVEGVDMDADAQAAASRYAGRGNCRFSTASRPRPRRTPARRAVRAAPSRHRRRPCRSRRRCRSSRRGGWRRSAGSARKALPCARSDSRPAP